MKAAGRIKLFEIVLYAVIFLAALSITLYTGHSIRGDWQGAVVDWLRIAPFIVVFLINNFLLCPKLLFKEKYTAYLLCCLALVAISPWAAEWGRDAVDAVNGPFMPDRPFHGGPGGPGGLEQSLGNGPGVHGPRPGGPPHGKMPQFFFGQAIITFLLIGFNTGVKVFVRYAREKIDQGEKDRQHLTTELAYLRNQISPHFLMNTLNNIHALVEIDRERAQDAIVKLANMMRYLLYESEQEMVPLSREVGFIGSYIELMRLRYGEKEVEVVFDHPAGNTLAHVPAFLLLSFVENAFKHGIRSSGGSFIRMAVKQNAEELEFTIANTVGDRRTAHDEASGIGVENIRKRLDLLYGERYRIEVADDGKVHKVTLNLPI